MSVKDDFHPALMLSLPDHEPTHVCKEEASVGIVRVALGLTALVMEPRKWFCYFFSCVIVRARWVLLYLVDP